MRCKAVFCDEHAKRKGFKYAPGQPIPCPKCGHPLDQAFCLSISTRQYAFGRQRQILDEEGEWGDYSVYDDDDQADEASSEEDEEGEDENNVVAAMGKIDLHGREQ